MAVASYDEALRRLLADEGGYSNDARDPGGPTKFGITLADYRKYMKPNATAADVQAMTVAQATAIYRQHYWDALACDELPAGVDYAVFDYGVNSGVSRADKVLRRCLGLSEAASRVAGDAVAAARTHDAERLIIAICDERIAFLRSLKTWDAFGRGWSRRVAEVRQAALAMASRRSPAATLSNPARAATAAAVSSASVAGAAHAAGLPLWAVLVTAIAAALAVAVAAHFISTGKDRPMWDTIKASFRRSLTILWARVVAAAGVALALAQGVLADASVNAAIQQAIQPQYIPYYVIAIGLITEIARRRTAGRN